MLYHTILYYIMLGGLWLGALGPADCVYAQSPH